MKTAERILYTALSLFNERGENSVTSVDIAMELDISPGNLYYHYKGKEVMVDKLIALHKNQLLQVLRRDLLDRIEGQEAFYYLYLIIEKLHVFRFFYRSPGDLAEKYPHSHKVRKQLVDGLESQLYVLLEQMANRDELIASTSELPLLTELLTLTLTQSFQYDQLGRQLSEEAQRYHCLSLVLISLLPRLRLPEEELLSLRKGIDSHSLANLRQPKWQNTADSQLSVPD